MRARRALSAKVSNRILWRIVSGIFWIPVLPHAPVFGQMHDYDSKYYTIHTDIDSDDVIEAVVRMTRMAEEYHDRTKDFSGTINKKFPFYLFRSSEDYFENGGLRGTAGVFIVDETGERLMAIAGRKTTLNTWHAVQHEGFHQFAHAVIGGKMPIWLNEGLAEYFGESIFTGDGFVTGVIPPWRLSRLKREIEGGQTKSIRDIMNMSPEHWIAEMKIGNYDQAWSMVHFLVHAENGKYEEALSSCIRAISQGRSFDRAWLDSIGPADGFGDRWKEFWLSQPASPTSTLYARAAVATMTSFLARATSQNQKFTDFAAFAAAADSNDIHINPDDWLPQSLLVDTLRGIGTSRHPELHTSEDKQPSVLLILEDGTRLTGSFTLRDPRVDQVHVDVDDLPRILKDADAIIARGGKKSDARNLVRGALRDNPKSSAAVEARNFLRSAR